MKEEEENREEKVEEDGRTDVKRGGGAKITLLQI